MQIVLLALLVKVICFVCFSCFQHFSQSRDVRSSSSISSDTEDLEEMSKTFQEDAADWSLADSLFEPEFTGLWDQDYKVGLNNSLFQQKASSNKLLNLNGHKSCTFQQSHDYFAECIRNSWFLVELCGKELVKSGREVTWILCSQRSLFLAGETEKQWHHVSSEDVQVSLKPGRQSCEGITPCEACHYVKVSNFISMEYSIILAQSVKLTGFKWFLCFQKVLWSYLGVAAILTWVESKVYAVGYTLQMIVFWKFNWNLSRGSWDILITVAIVGQLWWTG